MPAGTWNLGRLHRTVRDLNIRSSNTILIRDTSESSQFYFNIKEMPNEFTMGKNLIKIKANSGNLIDRSKIHFEIIDSSGNPIYYEPLNYIEKDGSRVIAIWIYKDITPPGPCTVYISGRARQDEQGNQYAVSNEWQDPNFKNFPNVLWSRVVSVSPEKQNSSQIIFADNPRVTVKERSVSYQQPINVADVYMIKTGFSTGSDGLLSSSIQIDGFPDSSNTKNNSILNNNTTPVAYEGGDSRRSPTRTAGTMSPGNAIPSWNANERDSSTAADGTLDQALFGNPSEAANETVAPAEITSTGYNIVNGESRLTTQGTPGFRLSASMEGGFIKIQAPIVIPDAGTPLTNWSSSATAGGVIDFPVIQLDQHGGSIEINKLADGQSSNTLSGSFIFRINKVQSTTVATVSQIEGPGHVIGTEGAFGFPTIKSTNNTLVSPNKVGAPKPYIINSIKASGNFTSSHTEPFVTKNTLQSQSFAEIILSNIEPKTGDVYKVKTMYKAVGQLGDFIDAGDTILEDIEMLEDVTSFENIPSVGMIFNRIGYFTSLADFSKYWSVNGASTAPEVSISTTYTPGTLMSSITLTPDEDFSNTNKRFAYIHLKEGYRPKLTRDTIYKLEVNVHNTNTAEASTAMPYIDNSRIDVYISGSVGSIQGYDEFKYAYAARDNDGELTETIYNSNDILGDDKGFGIRIGTIELPETEISQGIISIPFTTTKNQSVDVIFMSRRGNWTISNVALKASKDSGFSPNYTRINVRVPSEFINTPLTFKFMYYDYQNNQASAVSEIFPVEFGGDNLYLQGENNLLTGSMFIGNTLSSGIEQAGRNSAFIRSVGYEGYQNKLEAPDNTGSGGFLIYSGSILPGETNFFGGDIYKGVGIELVDDTDKGHLIFHTNPSVLDIKATDFFIGNQDSAFISGSNGEIIISSSNFFLDSDGSVTIGADATILGSLSVEDIFTPAQSPLNADVDGDGVGDGELISTAKESASAFISSSGEAGFLGDRSGSYGVIFNRSGSTMQVKESPTGRVIMDTQHQFFDGLNQGRVVPGPTGIQALTPHRKLRNIVAIDEYVPLYPDPENSLGTLFQDGNAFTGINDLDLQRGRNLIPPFYFNPEDDYLLIMYNAATFTYHEQDGQLHPVNMASNGEEDDCSDLTAIGTFNTGPNVDPSVFDLGFYSFTLPGFDLSSVFQNLYDYVTFNPNQTFGNDTAPGMTKQAGHLRFILNVSDPSKHTSRTLPAVYSEVVNEPSHFTTGGLGDIRHFTCRTGFGSHPRPFSSDHPIQSGENQAYGNANIPWHRYPIHDPGIIIIRAAGTCDDSGMYTDLRGKNISIRSEIKRGNSPTGDELDCDRIQFSVKDIRIVMCRKIQLQGLIDSFTNNQVASEVFGAMANPFASLSGVPYLHTAEFEQLGTLLQPVYTYYTGSEAESEDQSFEVTPSHDDAINQNITDIFTVPGYGCGNSMEDPEIG